MKGSGLGCQLLQDILKSSRKTQSKVPHHYLNRPQSSKDAEKIKWALCGFLAITHPPNRNQERPQTQKNLQVYD